MGAFLVLFFAGVDVEQLMLFLVFLIFAEKALLCFGNISVLVSLEKVDLKVKSV